MRRGWTESVRLYCSAERQRRNEGGGFVNHEARRRAPEGETLSTIYNAHKSMVPANCTSWHLVVFPQDQRTYTKYIFYKKLKNVSCEYNRLNGRNSTLQAAWYIRRYFYTDNNFPFPAYSCSTVDASAPFACLHIGYVHPTNIFC